MVRTADWKSKRQRDKNKNKTERKKKKYCKNATMKKQFLFFFNKVEITNVERNANLVEEEEVEKEKKEQNNCERRGKHEKGLIFKRKNEA